MVLQPIGPHPHENPASCGSELAEGIRRQMEMESAKARERHAANGGDRKSEAYRKSATPNLGEPIDKHDGETLEQLAKLAGTSRDTIRKGEEGPACASPSKT